MYTLSKVLRCFYGDRGDLARAASHSVLASSSKRYTITQPNRARYGKPHNIGLKSDTKLLRDHTTYELLPKSCTKHPDQLSTLQDAVGSRGHQ